MNRPIGRPRPRSEVKAILKKALGPNGTVCLGGLFEGHSVGELWADDLTTLDAENLLRGGHVEQGYWKGGEWRYPVRTARMTFVIAVESESKVTVVTGWRNDL